MNEPTRRLFIGLLPDEGVRDAIAHHQTRWFWGDARPTPPERLHLTLHFLGEVDATHELALKEALAGETVAPFDLVLQTPELWSGRTAVLRPAAHPALDDLQARLARRLPSAGLAPHRGAFAPHVTLARDAPQARPPEATRPIAWTVNDFVLIWSRRTAPVRYEELARCGAG